MGRFSRGLEMTKLSFSIIKRNPSLMVFPVISGVTLLIILSVIFMGFWFVPGLLEMPEWMYIIFGLLIYIIMFFVSYYFQAALVACAYATLEGEKPTVGYGLKKASSRMGSIFMWAVISAIIGMILKLIEERVGIIGKIIIRIVGAAWAVVTYFVVPVIVFENPGAWASVKKSWSLIKSTWGEALVGYVAVSIIFGLLALPFILFIILAFQMPSLVLALIVLLAGVVYLAFIMALNATVAGVLQAALYRYATTGKLDIDVPQWFPQPMTTQPQATQYPPYGGTGQE